MGIRERFRALFGGLGRAFGLYIVDGGPSKSGKVQGRPRTVRQRITNDHYGKHLDGELGLGVIPIRDDATVIWAAIDIDVYDLNLAALAALLKDTPIVVCRTKSGGAHAIVFFVEGVPARPVRTELARIAASLGFRRSEIFPKQDHLQAEDVGNWLNLPYQGGARTTRYAIAPEDGRALSLEEFVDLAEAKRTTLEALRAVRVTPPRESEEFDGCPPCLERLVADGVPEGARNNALFDFGVFARAKWPADFENRVRELNDRLMSPPLPAGEVRPILRSVGRKGYVYKCKDAPIAALCDYDECVKRRYGVTRASPDGGRARGLNVEIGRVVRVCTDPPTYSVEIDGVPVEMEVEDLLEQRRFQRRALARANRFVQPVKGAIYAEAIQAIIDRAEQVDAPEAASPRGQFWILVERFLTERAAAKTKDELLNAKPWHDPDTNNIFFRFEDLRLYLESQRFREFSQTQVYALLQERDVLHVKWTLKGKHGAYWGLSATLFTRQTEPHDPVRTDTGGGSF